MGIFMVIKNDIRKRKSQTVILILLSLLITLLMTTAVSVLWQSREQYDLMARKVHAPEVINIFTKQQKPEAEKVYQKLKTQAETKSVQKEDILLVGQDNSVRFGGDKWFSNGIIIRAVPGQYTLAEGSLHTKGIYVPVSLQSSEQLKLQESVTLQMSGQKKKYPIAGFFEDPFLGGAMTGYKQLFLDQETFRELMKSPRAQLYQASLVSLWTKADAGTNFTDRMKTLNENTGFSRSGSLYMESSMMKMSSMILTDVFMGLIFLFSLLLLVIMLITIRYLIASSLEDDYKEIGVLNALGYSKKTLVSGKMLYMILLFILGGAGGCIGSIFTVSPLARYAMDGSGILWHGGVRPVPVLASVTVMAVFVLLVSWLSLKRIYMLSTIQAIRNGKEDIYFKKRYQVPMERLTVLPLPLRMAVKNVFVRLPQYMLLIIVCGFMVFSLVSISALNENMKDIKKTAALFGNTDSDISVSETFTPGTKENGNFEEFMKTMKQEKDVRSVYSSEHEYVDMDGQKMLLSVISRFTDGNYQEPLDGRIPKYDNEMMLTEISSKYLSKNIGDTVRITYEGKEKKYLVVGLYQSSNDGGKIGCMTVEGFRKIAAGYKYHSCEILLKDQSKEQKVIKRIGQIGRKAGLELKTESVRDQVEEMMSDIQNGILALVVLFYVLCLCMSGFITFLLSMTFLKQQKRDLAIQRSLGYPVRQLRLQFALGFGIIGLSGALLGVLSVGLFTNRMFGALFGSIGITRFHAEITAAGVVTPVVSLTVFLIAFSYLISRVIKKYGVRQLSEDV